MTSTIYKNSDSKQLCDRCFNILNEVTRCIYTVENKALDKEYEDELFEPLRVTFCSKDCLALWFLTDVTNSR